MTGRFRKRPPGWRAAIAGVGLAAVPWWGCGEPARTTEEILANATYLAGTAATSAATLVDGAYDFPPGSEIGRVELIASATGDLDGDERTDAAVVLQESAGDARFLRLHAMLGVDEHIEDVATRLLGDRLEVERVTIEDGVIGVRLKTRRPGENVERPLSVVRRTRYLLTNRGLVPVNPPTVLDTPASRSLEEPLSLTSHEWVLTSIERGDWRQSTDALEHRPTLHFAQELGDPSTGTGRLYGYAGCNQLVGDYQIAEGASIDIHGLAVTRRVCGKAATVLEEQILGALETAHSFSIVDDGLTIAFNGGTVRLRAGNQLEPPSPPETNTAAADEPPSTEPPSDEPRSARPRT